MLKAGNKFAYIRVNAIDTWVELKQWDQKLEISLFILEWVILGYNLKFKKNLKMPTWLVNNFSKLRDNGK